MRGDFDQQLLARLVAVGESADPCSVAEPAYVFRWSSTGAYHGQALMRGPENETWYAAAELAALSQHAAEAVAPVLDHQTNSYLNERLKLTCHE